MNAIPEAVRKAAAAAPRGVGALEGPYRLSPLAIKAGSPAALNLREGSARFRLMKYCFANAARNPKGFTVEQLEKAADGQRQAIQGMLAYGFLK